MPVLRAHLVDGRVLVKFSPDQPRDDHGRWTNGDSSIDTHNEALAGIWRDTVVGTGIPPTETIHEGNALVDSIDPSNVGPWASDPDVKGVVKSQAARAVASQPAMQALTKDQLVAAMVGYSDSATVQRALVPWDGTISDGPHLISTAVSGGPNVVGITGSGDIDVQPIENVADLGLTPETSLRSENTPEQNLAVAQKALAAANASGAYDTPWVMAGTPEATEYLRQGVAKDLISTWAGTSNDNNWRALAVQAAAAQQLGITDYQEMTPQQRDALTANPDAPSREQVQAAMPAFRAFVQSEYDATQADLAAHGITQVTLYRGSRDGYYSGTTSATLRPLSSWSTSPDVAENFTGPTYSTDGSERENTIRMTVPASAIVSTPRTGAGCLNEYEFVVKGGTYPVDVGSSGGEGAWKTEKEWAALAASTGTTWHEDTDAKQDWIKTLSWDLPTDPAAFLRAIGGRGALAHFLTLPAAEAMPHDLATHLGVPFIVKTFNPDQPRDDHGRWTSGGVGDELTYDGDKYVPNVTNFDAVVQGMGWHEGGYTNPANAKANADLNAHGLAAQAGIKVDYGSIDPALAAEIDKRVGALTKAYPGVKIAYVGTAQDGMTEQQTWTANDPATGAFTESVTGFDYMRSVGVNLEQDGSQQPTNAQIDEWDKKVIADPAGYRIVINPRTNSDAALAGTLATYGHEQNFTIERDPVDAVMHEFGHAAAMEVGWVPGDTTSFDSHRLGLAMMGEPFQRAPKYASVTPQETQAEAWSAMHESARQPQWAKDVWDVVYRPTYGDPAVRFKQAVTPTYRGANFLDSGLDALGQPMVKAYNPDQPRDDHGRWTSEGGPQQAVDAAYASAVANDEAAARGKTVADYAKKVEISPEKAAENHRLNENLAQGTDAAVLRHGLFPPKAIDYGVIDPATAQRLNRELSTLQAQYPEVSLGSVQAGNLNPGVYAQTDDGSGKAAQTITFNQGMMDAPGELRTRLTADEASGFHPPNCDTPEFIAAHEYGHALANSLPRQTVSQIAGLGRAYLEADYVSHPAVGTGLSRYAQTNVNEFIAEAFGDYAIHGDAALPVSVTVGTDLARAYASRHGKAATPDLSKFDPSQPRDERGRWTISGGITGAEAADLVHQGIQGGFSYNPTTHRSPTDGYMVARAGATVTVPAGSKAEGAKGLVTFIDQHHAMFEADPSLYIGGWVEDGKLWIEPSDNISDRAFAEQVGAKRDQIAIFDVKALDVIQTGGTGGDRADPAWNVHPDLIPRGKAAHVPAPAGGVAADVAKREGGVGARGARTPVPGRVDHWPGWGADEDLVAHFAPRIAHAIQRNLNVDAIVSSLPATTKSASPEFAHHLDTAQKVLGAFGVDTSSGVKVLAELYGQGYVLGTHSATQAADKMGWPAAQVYPASDAILRSPGLATLLSQANVTIKSVAANRMDRLATVLAQGMSDGLPPREIADDLQSVMLDPSWAETVARTETARAQTAGAFNEYQRIGVDRVEFLTAQDDRECDLCLENEDAGIRDVTDPSAWPEGDPPVHPNCRCAVAPVPATDAADAAAAEADVNAPTLLSDAEHVAEGAALAEDAAGVEMGAEDAVVFEPGADTSENPALARLREHISNQQQHSQQQDATLDELEQSIASAPYVEEFGSDYTGFDQNVTGARPDTTPPTSVVPGIVPIPALPPAPNTPKPGSTTPKPSKQNGQTSRPRRPRPPKRG